jgi:hypothetical protein
VADAQHDPRAVSIADPLSDTTSRADDRRREDRKFPIGGPAKDHVLAIASPIGPAYLCRSEPALERSLLPPSGSSSHCPAAPHRR